MENVCLAFQNTKEYVFLNPSAPFNPSSAPLEGHMRANFWWFQLDPDASLDICRDAALDAATYNLDSSL